MRSLVCLALVGLLKLAMVDSFVRTSIAPTFVVTLKRLTTVNNYLSERKTALSMAIKGPVRYTTNDWVECLLTWPTSRIMKRIKYSLLFSVVWTVVLTFLYKRLYLNFNFPAAVHSISGSTLSLLLVFRTNSSYDRFWEGRKCWSAIVVACRDIARMVYLHLQPKYFAEFAKMLVAFALTLKQHLQGEKRNSELTLFSENAEELEAFQAQKNRPLILLSKLSKRFHEALAECHAGNDNAVVNTLHEHQFAEYVHNLGSSMAACERIVKQPVPLSYSRHTSRFLTLYLLSLPLTLIPMLGWSTVPTMLAICWSFLSVQEIGHFIEDPFDKETQIIPLNLIISVMRSDISEMLGGVFKSKEYVEFDEKIVAKAKSNARIQDETWFEYY